MMTRKSSRKTLCFIYILTLLLWGVCSNASAVSEITAIVCDSQECYVNCGSAIHDLRSQSSVITSSVRHLPAQEYLSVRNSTTSETLSAAANHSQRHFTRSIRQIAAHLFCNTSFSGIPALSGLLLAHNIPAYSPCGIIITNYIHLKDGQKSAPFFTHFTMV